MSKGSCPWHLQNVMCPWHFRMSHAPGTQISSLWSSPHEQSSHHAHPMTKIHTFGDLLQWDCLGSPLSIGGAVLPMLRSSISESWPWAICHTGLLKYSTPGVPHWYMGRDLLHLWLVHTVIKLHRVCDGNINSHMSGGWPLGKCHTFLFCSQWKKSIFIWLLMSGIRQLTYASWWNDGCWLLSTCHEPHIGHHNFGCCRCYLSFAEERLMLWAHSSGGQITQRLSA